MHSIFESNFEDIMVNFKELKSDAQLTKFLIQLLSKPKTKAGFVWQMSGNRLRDAILDSVDSLNDDTDYYIIEKTYTVNDILSFEGNHIYDTYKESLSDESAGFVIFPDFTRSSQELRNFVIGLLSQRIPHFLGKNWRIILTGNIDSGNQFWDKSYEKYFINVEYNPKQKADSDEMEMENESLQQPIEKSSYMTPQEAKDKIYTIIYNAAKRNEIGKDEYIYIGEDSVIVDSFDSFDPEMRTYIKPASQFIDFDSLSTGNVIIYTKPLMLFIEENVKTI